MKTQKSLVKKAKNLRIQGVELEQAKSILEQKFYFTHEKELISEVLIEVYNRTFTRVVFRKFPEGDIIALFPELEDRLGRGYIESYMHIGQHGNASELLIEELEIPTQEAYMSLAEELESIGYILDIAEEKEESLTDAEIFNYCYGVIKNNVFKWEESERYYYSGELFMANPHGIKDSYWRKAMKKFSRDMKKRIIKYFSIPEIDSFSRSSKYDNAANLPDGKKGIISDGFLYISENEGLYRMSLVREIIDIWVETNPFKIA